MNLATIVVSKVRKEAVDNHRFLITVFTLRNEYHGLLLNDLCGYISYGVTILYFSSASFLEMHIERL